ncbi:hypothetical protein EPA93_18515 [Ktedonosporobacter rubrisoli]|uniref:Uncharacterized protein n=1 Tax=Ktedonosporobacter rubrisoli TaxID=2509675 RepID=A0A4P6JR05_KTERU|nr:zinc ribbon domain-containing protein [Ktedonosporobacter rubrisoli]QBD77877.1 hypothetical protein EPA93_18515 [Ktedonosporobacter rubrisoli]
MQHCPRCKFAISSTARFCARCGLKLSETNQNPPSAALAKPAVPTKPLSISGPLPSESTTIQQADKKASTAGSVSGPLTPSSARGASEQVEAPLLASKNEQETIQPVNTPSTASISDQAEQGAEAKALPAPTSEQDATQTQEAKEDKAETTKKSTRSTAPLSTSTGPLTGQSHISGPLPSPSPAAEKHKQVATVSGLQAAEKLQTDVSEQDETLATNAGTILSSGKQAKAPAPKQSATPETGEMTARAALRSTTRDLKPIISSETDVTTEAQADQQAIKSGQAEAEDEPSHKISSSDEEEDIPDSGKEDIATTSRPVSGPLDASQVAKSTRKSIVPKRPTGPIPPRPTTQKEAQAASSSRFRVPSRPLSSSPNFPPVPETPHIDQPRKSSTAPLQEEGQGQQEQEGSSFLPVPETPAPQSLETEERNTLPTIPETPYPSMLEATYPSTEIEEPQDIADQATRPYAAHKDEEQEAQSQQEPEQPVTSSYPPLNQ